MPETVRWHCEDCNRSYDSRALARTCCQGSHDDHDAATGVHYTHYDGQVGVFVGP